MADKNDEMQKLFDEIKAQPKPEFNIEQYRITPEAKAHGDHQVATNIRSHFPGIIILHTDSQLADAYEVARNDDKFDPNFGDADSKKFYLDLVSDLYCGTSVDLGEHQEVLDAIEQCNTGESE